MNKFILISILMFFALLPTFATNNIIAGIDSGRIINRIFNDNQRNNDYNRYDNSSNQNYRRYNKNQKFKDNRRYNNNHSYNHNHNRYYRNEK